MRINILSAKEYQGRAGRGVMMNTTGLNVLRSPRLCFCSSNLSSSSPELHVCVKAV